MLNINRGLKHKILNIKRLIKQDDILFLQETNLLDNITQNNIEKSLGGNLIVNQGEKRAWAL